MDNLQRFVREVRQCMKCGFCMYFCPVYQELRTETAVARGRNVLAMELLEGAQFDWDHLEERFGTCLLCNRCAQFCPARVNAAAITLAVRGDIVERKGLAMTKRLVFAWLIGRRGLFGRVLRFASWGQRLLPGGEGKVRHLPLLLSALGKGRQIPEIAGRFLRDSLPEVVTPSARVKRQMRVGLFAGCAIDYLFPHIGKRSIAFLNQQGVEVVFPKGQGCCGMPAIGSGAFSYARRMADKNWSVFSALGVDYIITLCATCGSALKEGYLSYLADTPEQHERYRWLKEKVKDINEFVVDILQTPPEVLKTHLPEGTRVTYHDPCHLVRYQRVSTQPRTIIKALPGIEFVEMPDADRCCGMGGGFNIEHYQLSQRIAAHKMEAISASGADIVATACPGCMIQLIDQGCQRGMSQRVVHVMELIAPDQGYPP